MIPPVEQLVPPSDFAGFNSSIARRSYEQNLPYWSQPGASFFLTFRLSDSLPNRTIDPYLREQEAWRVRIQYEREHSGKMAEDTETDYEAFLLRACRAFEAILDKGHGSCVFKDPIQRQVVTDALLQFHGEHYQVYGFAVMPNHVHMVLKPLDDHDPEELLISWMKSISQTIRRSLQPEGGLWHREMWIRIVRNEEHWLKTMRYTLRNPERAKLPHGQSTVWWDPGLFDLTRSLMREDGYEEPW